MQDPWVSRAVAVCPPSPGSLSVRRRVCTAVAMLGWLGGVVQGGLTEGNAPRFSIASLPVLESLADFVLNISVAMTGWRAGRVYSTVPAFGQRESQEDFVRVQVSESFISLTAFQCRPVTCSVSGYSTIQNKAVLCCFLLLISKLSTQKGKK